MRRVLSLVLAALLAMGWDRDCRRHPRPYQVHEILARRDALPPASPDAFVVERTALDYLPTALESYLNLPRAYANRVPSLAAAPPGRSSSPSWPCSTPSRARFVEAVTRGDTDRLLAHGRFLEDRFARSEMDLG